MKSLVLALVLLATPATAADMRLPVKAPAPTSMASTYSWTGIYLSGYADYAVDVTNSQLFSGATTADIGGTSRGPGVGGALSALWQLPSTSWVIGVEAELGWLNATATGAATTAGISTLSLSNATNYLGAVDGELGYTLDSSNKVLLSVLGGFAFGGAKPDLTVLGTSTSTSGTSVGWNAGAKLAYAMTNNLSLFIKGEYYQLGSKSLNLAGAMTSTTPYNFFVQEGGLSFKF